MYMYVCINDLRSIGIIEYAYVRTLYFQLKTVNILLPCYCFQGMYV